MKNYNKVLSQLTIHEIRSILLFLRLYLVKKRIPSVWNEILKLEGHLETRRDTKIWFKSQNTVIDVLKKYDLIDEKDKENEELLQKICGIIDVNSFELRSPGTFDESPLRGLYTEASLMAHECRGNTHITVDDDFQLTVYASCPINEGEGIFYHYTSPLLVEKKKKHIIHFKIIFINSIFIHRVLLTEESTFVKENILIVNVNYVLIHLNLEQI